MFEFLIFNKKEPLVTEEELISFREEMDEDAGSIVNETATRGSEALQNNRVLYRDAYLKKREESVKIKHELNKVLKEYQEYNS